MKNNVTAPIRLAWRLAAHTMWAMKLRVLIAALIIAAPMCVAVSLHADREIISDTVKAHQVQTYGSFGTMIQRKWASKTALAEHDRAVKDIVGQEAVMTVSSPTGTLMNNYECPECERRILWTPAQGALGKNSQLVSGRWPKHSNQLLVSDHAVANGAQSSGPISLKLGGGQEAEQYNIVGVARTIIGEKPVLYTSVLDERITTRGELPIGGQFTTWFVPEKRLTTSQTEQLGRLGYTIRYRDNVEASKAHWTHPAMPYFALTALASVAVLQVFAFGLGRLRQTLNTIIQNGGSRRFVLLCAAAQGLILAGLGAAIVTVVGAIAVTIAYHTKSLHQYPLGIDLRTIPAGMVATSSMVVAACALVTSMIPAIGLTQGNVAEQAKTFTARDADKTLATPKLRVWHVVTLVAVCLGWAGLFAAGGWEAGSRGKTVSNDPATYFAALAPLVVGSLVVGVAVSRVALGKARESLFRRQLIDEAVRKSLAASGVMVGVAACAFAALPGNFMYMHLLTPVLSNPSGITTQTLQNDDKARGIEILKRAQNQLGLSESQAFTTAAVDRTALVDAGIGDPKSSIYMGTCTLDVGQVFKTNPCSSEQKSWSHVAVVDLDRIVDVYRLTPTQREKIRNGAILEPISSASPQRDEQPTPATLVTFAKATGSQPNTTVVKKSMSLDVLRVDYRGWPQILKTDGVVLMATEFAKTQKLPLHTTDINIKRRQALTFNETTELQQVTGGYGAVNLYLAEWNTAFSNLAIYAVPCALLGLLLALSSFKLAGKLSTMKKLGAAFKSRHAATLRHCLVALSVSAVAGLSAGTCIAALAYGAFVWGAQPLYTTVSLTGAAVTLSGILVIPLFTLLFAPACTWMWSRTGLAGQSNTPSAYVAPVLGALALGLTLIIGFRFFFWT